MKNLLLGIGNILRQDDGLGVKIVEAIRAEGPFIGWDIKLARGEASELMEAWKGYDRLVVVDAVSGLGAVGELIRLDWEQHSASFTSQNASSHNFGLKEALELSDVFGEKPKTVQLWGVEADCFAMGQEICSAVKRSMEKVHLELLHTLKMEATCHA